MSDGLLFTRCKYSIEGALLLQVLFQIKIHNRVFFIGLIYGVLSHDLLPIAMYYLPLDRVTTGNCG